MADRDDQSPLRVVDRRWWARGETDEAVEEVGVRKPTYVEDLERRLADQAAQLQSVLTDQRRVADEFDSVKQRMRRDTAREVERARRAILAEMLEVVDNLDRAIEAAGRSATPDALLQGVEMVRRQFLSKLEGLGVKRIETEGASFDPVKHEAVSAVPAANPEDDGRVVGVVRHGYTIGDDVLRPAAVAVAKS